MGRIGKPQKSGKAKKIKAIDPFYKGDRKDSYIKHKDQRPTNDDRQEFPRKVRQMMEAVSEASKPPKKRKKKNIFYEADEMHPSMTKPMDSIPQFKQQDEESHYKFMNRVEKETSNVLQQSKLESKYKTKFVRDESGELVPMKTRLSKKKKKRLKERKEKKKVIKQEKRQDRISEFDALKDEVKFGEVVLAPPTITAKPRKSSQINQTKPGQRSLLLKEIMYGQTGAVEKGTGSRKIGETVKRKNLTPVQQLITDTRRQSAIDSYRLLKNKKQKVA